MEKLYVTICVLSWILYLHSAITEVCQLKLLPSVRQKFACWMAWPIAARNWAPKKEIKMLERTSFRFLDLSQYDQMVRLFLNIWTFATMKTSPITLQICQSRLSISPKKKWPVKNLPKTCKFLPKWWFFSKSGHTDSSIQSIQFALVYGELFLVLFYLSNNNFISFQN